MDFPENAEQNTKLQIQTQKEAQTQIEVQEHGEIQAEALAYFKNTGFKRVFEGFKEKYASLGYVGGIVKINSLKHDEKQVLSGFLGKDLSRQKSVCISASNFQKCINNSRFEGISVGWLVSSYFDGQLLYRKALKQQAEIEQKEFFERLIDESFSDEKSIEWLQGVISNKIAPYSQIMHEYNENRDSLFKLMKNVLQGLAILPDYNNGDCGIENSGNCNLSIIKKNSKNSKLNSNEYAVTDNVGINEASYCKKIDCKEQIACDNGNGTVVKIACNKRIEDDIRVKEERQKSPNKEKQMMRLPMFATKITGDPHYFDKSGKAFIYLLHGAYHRIYGTFLSNVSLSSEEESEILYKAGLMKDDISNFVMCYGIKGAIKEVESDYSYSGIDSGIVSKTSTELKHRKFENYSLKFKNYKLKDNSLKNDARIQLKEHLGLKGFFDLGQPIMLSLLNISCLEMAFCVRNKVYVFENPSVFAEFIEADRQRCGVSAICSAGQPNLAVLLLLDLVVVSGSEIYYSGDFDPEGLLIADRLKARYGDSLNLWHLGIEDYSFCISEKEISKKRLKQLEKLKDDELIKVAEVMKEAKKAGYQEKLIDRLKQ